MNADEFRRLAEVVGAVDDLGATVENVDVELRERQGMASAMSRALGGEGSVEPVFTLRVSAGGVEVDPADDPKRHGTEIPLHADEQADAESGPTRPGAGEGDDEGRP